MLEKQWLVSLAFRPFWGFQLQRGVGLFAEGQMGAEREVPGKHSRRWSRLVASAARCLLVFSTGFMALGCSGQAANTAPPHSAAKINASPSGSAELARTVVTPQLATDIPELFAKATAEGQSKQY